MNDSTARLRLVSTFERVFAHGPNERLDYAVDWSDVLPEGDSITESTWTLRPSTTPPLSTAATVRGATRTEVVLHGGKIGLRYRITNAIETSEGMEAARQFYIEITHPR